MRCSPVMKKIVLREVVPQGGGWEGGGDLAKIGISSRLS